MLLAVERVGRFSRQRKNCDSNDKRKHSMEAAHDDLPESIICSTQNNRVQRTKATPVRRFIAPTEFE